MQKLPKGISSFKELRNDNCYYVDKTKYIEKLEKLADKRIMFLRPRKFGKTLFTNMLECYYDVNMKDKFETLFRETYIGQNPTNLRNNYYILHFDFSGIDTSSYENTIKGFSSEIKSTIKAFIYKYNINFKMEENEEVESIQRSFFKDFSVRYPDRKLYIIIDEYDHFANELLSFDTDNFVELMSRNGKVRKWYEVLKSGTTNAVERIFITGVAPITLDSLTSGFNIEADLTRDERFNGMMGFTEEELINLMNDQEISKEKQIELLPIMKENYDGYKFSKYANERLYNSNMCLYFLDQYIGLGRIPDELIDTNIASDYSKVENMLNLSDVEDRVDTIQKSLSEEGIETDITKKFNVNIGFTQDDMLSMLFYLGYLTIIGERYDYPVLRVPNKVMKEEYLKYYSKVMNVELDGAIHKE